MSNETISSEQPIEVLQGEVIRITYHDPESLFTVAKIKPSAEKKSKPVENTIVGAIPLLQVGHTIMCHGNWQIDPRHGRQFHVQKVQLELPKDPQSIQKLLSSGILKGVGPKTAEKIVAHLGEKTFFILQHDSSKLYEVEGLSKKKADDIIELWNIHTIHEETLLLLLSWGLTQTKAIKALQKWGHETLNTIRSNPYLLAQEIRGIGFLQADAIATRLKLPKESPERIQSAILFFISRHIQEGHTIVPLDRFITKSSEELEVSQECIQRDLDLLHGMKKIIFVQKESLLFVGLFSLHEIEKSIAYNLVRLQKKKSLLREIDTIKAVEWAEEKISIKLSEGQKEALITCLKSKISIITGGPGTGKSTITKALLRILFKLTSRIALAAPTGRAAKRLMEITGTHAKTIHRLLHYEPIYNRFKYNHENRLPYDVIIIDETSMVDTYLMASLLEAIHDSTKVILVGDVNQLPSIGPGTILKNCILSNSIPVSILQDIYRQSKRSQIIENAHRVNQGKMPWMKSFPGSDFIVHQVSEPHLVRQKTFELVTQELPNKYGFDPKKDIQILCPMRKGSCGIDQLNFDLQSYFSHGIEPLPESHGPRTRITFHEGDKVLQLKNNYTKEVFNGDIGFISKIHPETGLEVEMDDRVILYDSSELDELHLAWAVSVHKYQGSESQAVIIPLHTQHFTLLTRQLLYTAITRGKRLVILIGSAQAIAIAIKNTSADERWTFLQEAIQQLQ